ncbi:MAG TPA: GNAT family N-acetyltransferase [Acidimicrobiales bacterium]|nr:GNAT family N-acetyltransferase [Acidimicrobiales bacterium]
MPYPAQWEADVVMADGGTVHVRPIRPDDADRLRSLHQRLSAETIYLRFFSPIPTLSDAMVERFTNVDYVDRMALVAELGEDLVGVARYDRLGEGATTAEVAFVIDDAHQGRGLGTLLLEHLAATAREAGIHEFVADTLPGNNRMLNVFRAAGFGDERHLSDGVVRVRFRIDPTEASVSAMHDRERHAAARSVQRLLAPRSIAVIGASRTGGTLGHEVLRNLVRGGFAGPVFPVHPTATHVASIRAYPTVLDIPDAVDLAVIAVPAKEVPAVVDQCGAKGVGGLVVVSAGFSEAGPEGATEERQLVEHARRLGMRIVGPNSMGVVNTAPAVSMHATFAPVLAGVGRVGFVSQSGALGVAILGELGRRNLGVSTFVALGNKADVSSNDLIQFWEDDDATDIVLLYLESFGNPRTFSRVARRVARTKPVIAVKSGRRDRAEDAVEALFRQAGVTRVDTLEQLFDVAQALTTQRLPQGRRVAVVGNAAGPGALAVDAAQGAGLDVAALVRLPFDASPGDYEQALRDVLADPDVDAMIAVFTPPLAHGADEVIAAVERAAAGSAKPVLGNFLLSTAAPETLPCFAYPESAALALARMVERAEWLAQPEGTVPDLDVDVSGLGALELLPLLGAFGIPTGPASDGRPLRVRVTQHESFGPVLALASADPLADLLGDEAYALVPLTDVDAARLVQSLPSAPLLAGLDVAALEDLLVRVGLLAAEVPQVAELTLEPVVVSAEGVAVLDGTLRVEPYQPHPEMDVRRLR